MRAYSSPLSILQLRNNLIVIVWTRSSNCLRTYRREIKVGNKSGCRLRVRAEEDVADTDISVRDPKLIKGVEAFGKGQSFIVVRVAGVPSAAHAAAFSNSTSDVYVTMLRPRDASTTR